MALKATIE
jgi:hypothetical protein